LKNHTGGDDNELIYRLQDAEAKARENEEEMLRWKREAERKGSYPNGLYELLEEGERIRQDTIRLLKMKKEKESNITYYL